MNASPASAALDLYVRTPDFELHVQDLELSPTLWDIFARTEGRVSAADIARDLGVETGLALLGLQELGKHKLVRRHVQRWQDYRSAKRPVAVAPAPAAAPVSAPVPRGDGLVPPPAIRLGELPVDTVPAPRPNARSAGTEIHFRLGPPAGRRPRVADSAGLIRFALRRAAAVPVAGASARVVATAVQEKAWPLRPIIDAILRHGGGGVSGQLLAYRVFLRVPADLLDRAGLHSLNLVADDFLLRDPELYAALSQSIRDVAGLDMAEIGGPERSRLPCA